MSKMRLSHSWTHGWKPMGQVPEGLALEEAPTFLVQPVSVPPSGLASDARWALWARCCPLTLPGPMDGAQWGRCLRVQQWMGGTPFVSLEGGAGEEGCSSPLPARPGGEGGRAAAPLWLRSPEGGHRSASPSPEKPNPGGGAPGRQPTCSGDLSAQQPRRRAAESPLSAPVTTVVRPLGRLPPPSSAAPDGTGTWSGACAENRRLLKPDKPQPPRPCAPPPTPRRASNPPGVGAAVPPGLPASLTPPSERHQSNLRPPAAALRGHPTARMKGQPW